jgi:hypothetical protein
MGTGKARSCSSGAEGVGTAAKRGAEIGVGVLALVVGAGMEVSEDVGVGAGAGVGAEVGSSIETSSSEFKGKRWR